MADEIRRGKHLRCDRHGRIEWLLTVVCAGCKRVYQIVPDGQEFVPICEGAEKAPERCECGKRLAPEIGVPGGGVFWARAICTDCFKSLVAGRRNEKSEVHDPSKFIGVGTPKIPEA
jgi:hypothetical protein